MIDGEGFPALVRRPRLRIQSYLSCRVRRITASDLRKALALRLFYWKIAGKVEDVSPGGQIDQYGTGGEPFYFACGHVNPKERINGRDDTY